MANHTELTFWNRTAVRTLVSKAVCVIRNPVLQSLLGSQELVCTELSLSGLHLPPLFSPLFYPSLHSSPVGSQCVLKHVSSQIMVRDDRPLALTLACAAYIWTRPWHHRAKCLVSAPKIVLPFSLPLLFPTARTAAVLTPVLNVTQDFLYFFWGGWWPYVPLTKAIKVRGFEFTFLRYFINEL